jgi:hypothetical protein
MTESSSEIAFISYKYEQASESGKVRLRSVKAKDA